MRDRELTRKKNGTYFWKNIFIVLLFSFGVTLLNFERACLQVR